MKQETITDIEYSFRKKKTKREEFLEIMDEIIPWDEWVGVIEPYYPNGKRGRPPMGIEKMLRMYLLQIWFNLSDPANRRPGTLPRVSDNALDWERYIENRKSSVRCKVEHAFRIIKCQFGYKKTAYRGLKKNENRLYAMFACANLYALAIAERKLCPA